MATKWFFEADYLQGCSCDYGCPCEFQAPPSRGFCEGMGAWKINRGEYGDINLDGLGFGFAARWPDEIYKGGGTAALFIDERASPEQRDALIQIGSGQAGGLPFEILVTTLVNVLPPQFVPFTFNIDGRNSSARMGDAVTIQLAPIKNPVTGESEFSRIEHETGFVFKTGEVVAAAVAEVSCNGLSYSWPSKAGFFAQIRYGN